jgi:DNA-binding NarL/FixJ family response regulator
MSNRNLKIVIVDDDESYRSKLTKKLSDSTITCIPVAPPPKLDVEPILAAKPDAVLVDYQLTMPQPGKPPADYLGSLLVAAIRDSRPTIPVVLLTRRSVVSGHDFAERAAALDEVFDDLLFKESVDAQPVRLRIELRSLAEGYRTLAKADGTWKDVFSAMKAPPYARDELRQLGSPGVTLPSEKPKGATDTFRTGSIARWVRRFVLRFPGPLVDDLRAATDLGIAAAAFKSKALVEWLEPARYTGVFAGEQRRWWRGALRNKANSLQPSKTAGDDVGAFLGAWNAKHRSAQLEPSLCCVCREPTRDAVCEVLHKPVMLRHSVQFYPDNRPAGFDVARISFKAIRTKQLNEETFASNVWPLVLEIERSKK